MVTGPQRGAQGLGGAGVGSIQQALGDQRGGERDLDLNRGLLGADQVGDPASGYRVQDGQRGSPGSGEVGEVVGPNVLGYPLGQTIPTDPFGSGSCDQ